MVTSVMVSRLCSSLRSENSRPSLTAENRRLGEDVDILRAATTFFVGELDPYNR